MDLGIESKRAAVAAGSGGLGYAVAAALAAEGVDVAICGRDEARLTESVNSLGETATGAWPIGLVADVSAAVSASLAYFVVSGITDAQDAKHAAWGRADPNASVAFDPRDSAESPGVALVLHRPRHNSTADDAFLSQR